MTSKPARNPGYTTLKSVGRTHRDEPFHLVYPLLLYPQKAKINPVELNDWCAVRYLNSRRKRGKRWRIETYKHQNGSRYVNRVFFEELTDEETMEMLMRFGTKFLDKKVLRTGKLVRPRLSKDEKAEYDAMRDQFYNEVARRRREAAAAQASLAFG